ncbi:rhomboid-domain-containing protein [Metschnikowia bicuspidata]|uniref:Rhomboid-domain-containing protein n=1 Tax=Metschnikowia bicuspidata TaxID=27322 RepID=A0A4P9Z9S1_9ASCO|nr:rhomboid-domain-containing protein [Metschnikowia bicuspidata]
MFRLPPNIFKFAPSRNALSLLCARASAIQALKGTRLFSTSANYNRHYGRNRVDWNKLKKPAIFTVTFCVATTYVTPYLLHIPAFSVVQSNPKLLVFSIIGLNVAGFFAWKSPVFARYMSRYGLLVKDNIRSQWSLLGSAFSHQEPFHLLFNMLMLFSFGTSFASAIGASNFLMLYLNSAVFSSFFSLAVPTMMRTSLAVASLGASGALFGLLGAFSYLIPKAAVSLFFIPFPGGAWPLFLFSVGLNIAGVFWKWGRYDYTAHLGGSVAGIYYGWYLKKFRRERSQRRRVVW